MGRLRFSVLRLLRYRLVAVVCLVAPFAVAPASATVRVGDDTPSFSWMFVDRGGAEDIVTVDAVSADVAWFATYPGSVLLTTDAGRTFQDVSLPGDEDWYYIDIEARSADKALLLVADLTDGRTYIFRTTDSGESWKATFRSPPYEGHTQMAMFNRKHGFAVSGNTAYPSNKFRIIVTGDAGRTWQEVDEAGIPESSVSEGVYGDTEAANATAKAGFFGTTNTAARVFRSTDFGLTWQVSSTSFGYGVTSPDFRTSRFGLASGIGDESQTELAWTNDGGASWTAVDAGAVPPGLNIDLEWWSDRRGNERGQVPDAQRIVFFVGLSGSNVSYDRGRTWSHFDDTSLYMVDCVERSADCWAGGGESKIARLVVE